jgi:hypothetical protein
VAAEPSIEAFSGDIWRKEQSSAAHPSEPAGDAAIDISHSRKGHLTLQVPRSKPETQTTARTGQINPTRLNPKTAETVSSPSLSRTPPVEIAETIQQDRPPSLPPAFKSPDWVERLGNKNAAAVQLEIPEHQAGAEHKAPETLRVAEHVADGPSELTQQDLASEGQQPVNEAVRATPTLEGNRATAWPASAPLGHQQSAHQLAPANPPQATGRSAYALDGEVDEPRSIQVEGNAQNLAIRIQDGNERRVNLRFAQLGDHVRLSVTSGDPSLARHLQTELRSLRAQLSESGLHTDLQSADSSELASPGWNQALNPRSTRESISVRADVSSGSADARQPDGGQHQRRHSLNWGEEVEDWNNSSALRRLQFNRKDL